MSLIEKWKNRETKKKLRQENIRLKAEIEAHMKTLYPVCTVERNINKVVAKRVVSEMERGIPADVIKHELRNKLSEHLSDFVEYDFENDGHGGIVYKGILYVAARDGRYETQWI